MKMISAAPHISTHGHRRWLSAFCIAGLLFQAVLPAVCASSDKIVRYSEYGAVGDGVTDDFDAIVKTHAEANKTGAKVRADAGATYYIGGAKKSAIIQTDTDWSGARFIIDDTKVENRQINVFRVSSTLPPVQLKSVKTLRKNQDKLDVPLSRESVVVVTDSTTKRYIRMGLNQNNGSAQTDVLVVDKNGSIDKKTPVLWDFDNITSITAHPIDSETLTVRGGHFTTIANREESRYAYYARGLNITRSNVVIDGITHAVTGEVDHGAPYTGFIIITNCARVTVQNCMLSGRKIHSTIGRANARVSMGSYDISVTRASDVTFKNCRQLNDIHDGKYWGIFGSNFSKNIIFDNVEFSRFDAHMGVTNATIKNSVLGHQGINLIGSGVFLVENTEVHGRNFINLRSDYGSTWEGAIIIRNCEYTPDGGRRSDAVLINGNNNGKHNFGYVCHMPKKITIDGLVINDTNPPAKYAGPKIFGAFNKAYTSDEYKEDYPYVTTGEVEIRNLKIKSGKPLVKSSNPFMFRNVRVTER